MNRIAGLDERPSASPDGRLEWCAERCAGRAWGLALSLVRDPHEADDVIQESFVVAARRRDAIPTDDPWPWFAAVVVNVSRDARKRRARKGARGGDDLERADGRALDPVEAAGTREMVDSLRRELAALPHEEREAVVTTRVGGMTTRQAAEVLAVSRSAVSLRAGKAMERLRRRLGVGAEPLAGALSALALASPPGGLPDAIRSWLDRSPALRDSHGSAAPGTPGASAGLLPGGMTMTRVGALALCLTALSLAVWGLGQPDAQMAGDEEDSAHRVPDPDPRPEPRERPDQEDDPAPLRDLDHLTVGNFQVEGSVREGLAELGRSVGMRIDYVEGVEEKAAAVLAAPVRMVMRGSSAGHILDSLLGGSDLVYRVGENRTIIIDILKPAGEAAEKEEGGPDVVLVAEFVERDRIAYSGIVGAQMWFRVVDVVRFERTPDEELSDYHRRGYAGEYAEVLKRARQLGRYHYLEVSIETIGENARATKKIAALGEFEVGQRVILAASSTVGFRTTGTVRPNKWASAPYLGLHAFEWSEENLKGIDDLFIAKREQCADEETDYSKEPAPIRVPGPGMGSGRGGKPGSESGGDPGGEEEAGGQVEAGGR